VSSYEKRDGKLIATPDFKKAYLRQAYKDLIVGQNPPERISRAILNTDFQPYSFVHYPYPGLTKAAALMLMRMKVSVYRCLHTHYLVEVFVSESEDDASLSSMQAPFFLLMHGVIRTPNRRLLDLIQEFCEYQFQQQVPWVIFSALTPERQLETYFETRGFTTQLIRESTEKDMF